MKLNDLWAAFVVRKVIAGKPMSLASVRSAVLTQLIVHHQRQIILRFSPEYVAHWKAKTSCRDGYVSPGCPQYHPALGAYEDPFSLEAHPVLSERAANGLTP
jgi:hypothetical protein